MKVLNVIDSFEYVQKNCFQHQLYSKMSEIKDVETRELVDVLDDEVKDDYDKVVLCLKQRSIDRNLSKLSKSLGGLKTTIYDQDPWASFTDDSPYKGSYERMLDCINVETFALTTKWWAEFLETNGYPATFVSMWVLPKYCNYNRLNEKKRVDVGFAGTVHPYRRELFSYLQGEGIKVQEFGQHNYDDYLFLLSNTECFVHSEDSPIFIDGDEYNLSVGLWIKDVEAAARGCFSFRNVGYDADSYLSGIKTAFQYNDRSELPEMIRAVQRMPWEEKLSIISETVEFIKSADKWQETAELLTMYSRPCESR